MPELPEVETVARGVKKFAKGLRVASLTINRPDLRVPFPQDLREKTVGAILANVRRRAKYILADFDNGHSAILHLGMSGRIALAPPGEMREAQKHDHLVMGFDNGAALVFNDPRRFGAVYLCKTGEENAHKALKGLGIEPLEPPLSGAAVQRLFRNKKSPVKTALLDGRLIVGVGNIYACEALFRAKIHPARPAGSLTDAEAAALAGGVVSALRDAIASGGSSLRDYRQTDGSLGRFQHSFAVYGREGKPCLGCDCGVLHSVNRIVQAGRSTFYCPVRQPDTVRT